MALVLWPGLTQNFDASPSGYAFPVVALAGLLGIAVSTGITSEGPGAEAIAYLSSCVWLVGSLASVGFAAGAGPIWWVSGTLLVAVCITLTAAAPSRPRHFETLPSAGVPRP
jgi:hypothetical protein